MSIKSFGLFRGVKNFIRYDDRLIRKMIMSNTKVLCLTSLLDAACVFFDELVAARGVGHDAMVAVGLSSPTFYIICIFTGVIAFGSQSLCTYYIGKGDKKNATSIFTDLVVLSVISTLVLTIVLLVFLNPICDLFGASKHDPAVYNLLHDYLKGLVWVVPGYIGFLSFTPFVILEGNRKCVWAASFVQLIVSVIGDIITVYIFDMGLYGVGMSTGVGYILATVVLLTNFRGETAFHFDIRLINLKYIIEIIWTGSPRFSKYISGFLIGIFINRIILLFGGNMAMAVFSVNNSVSTFLYMIGYGLSESVVYATQLLYGESARKELYKMMQTVVKISTVITCMITVLVIILRNPIARIFVKDGGNMLEHSMYAITFLALSIPIYTLNGIIIGYLSGARKVVYAKILTLVQKFIGYIAVAFVLGYFFGAKGLYASVFVCEVVTLLFYFAMACFYRKANTFGAKLLFIPKSFDEDIKSSFLFGVRNSDDISKILDSVSPLLKTEGYTDEKGLMRLHLCIEEIVGNVIENNFTLDKKTHNCNVRVMLYNDSTITICVRDDCPKFDLKEAYENMNKDNLSESANLKLIFGIPKEIKYNHLLGFNNTIVKI